MTYIERASEVASASEIAVQVLLGPRNDDMEFWPLVPRVLSRAELTSPLEFTQRQLRPVAVLGLQGLKPVCALREPLEPHVVSAIAQAFLEYCRVLLADGFAEQFEPAYDWDTQQYRLVPRSSD